MLEIDIQVYVYTLFAVLISSVLAFVLVTHKFRKSDLQIESVRLFEAYFILGIFGWIALLIKQVTQIQVGLTISAVFYLVCSYLLFLAVVECARNRLRTLLVSLFHLALVVLVVTISDDARNIFVISCYVILVYPVISYIAIRRACKLKNMGYAIIGAGVLLAICMAPVQIYVLSAMNDVGFAFGIVLTASATGYILVGIGFLTSILITEHHLLTSLALNDPLTGLFNRRGLNISMQSTLNGRERKQTCISAIVIDIDHFKNVNDNYGHDAGDVVLKSIADILSDLIRSSDVACRFGGEEFVVILPDTGLEAATLIAERIHLRIEQSSVLYEGVTIKVTVSLGVSSNCASVEIDELLKDADKQLYTAKEEGRNRVCVAKG